MFVFTRYPRCCVRGSRSLTFDAITRIKCIMYWKHFLKTSFHFRVHDFFLKCSCDSARSIVGTCSFSGINTNVNLSLCKIDNLR